MKCPECQYENPAGSNFCGKCGGSLKTASTVSEEVHIKNISVFFFFLLTYICLVHFSLWGDSYVAVLISDIIFMLIVLVFTMRYLRELRPLFRIRSLQIRPFIWIFTVAPIAALAVTLVVSFLNREVLSGQDVVYYEQYRDSPMPILLCLLSIAVVPAIFEEIAFRGIVFHESFRILSLKATILLTSILFTILHLSVISVIWLFPIGLALGYLRARYRNIIYSMVAHFTYNACIVVLDILLS